MSQPKVRRFLFVHLGAHSVWPMPFALRLLWLAHGVLAAVLPRFQKKWRLDLWLSARIPCGRWSKLGHPPFCHVCLFASGREGALKRQSFFCSFGFRPLISKRFQSGLVAQDPKKGLSQQPQTSTGFDSFFWRELGHSMAQGDPAL